MMDIVIIIITIPITKIIDQHLCLYPGQHCSLCKLIMVKRMRGWGGGQRKESNCETICCRFQAVWSPVWYSQMTLLMWVIAKNFKKPLMLVSQAGHQGRSSLGSWTWICSSNALHKVTFDNHLTRLGRP